MIKARSDPELDEETNETMNELVGFFAGSGLKLNNLKTELVNHNGRDAQVTVNQQGDVQQSAKTARLLGIIIDSNLNFHPHIDLLLKEMEYRMWQFRKISKIADRKNRLCILPIHFLTLIVDLAAETSANSET